MYYALFSLTGVSLQIKDTSISQNKSTRNDGGLLYIIILVFLSLLKMIYPNVTGKWKLPKKKSEFQMFNDKTETPTLKRGIKKEQRWEQSGWGGAQDRGCCVVSKHRLEASGRISPYCLDKRISKNSSLS